MVSAHRRERQALNGTFRYHLVTYDTVPSIPAGGVIMMMVMAMKSIQRYGKIHLMTESTGFCLGEYENNMV